MFVLFEDQSRQPLKIKKDIIIGYRNVSSKYGDYREIFTSGGHSLFVRDTIEEIDNMLKEDIPEVFKGTAITNLNGID